MIYYFEASSLPTMEQIDAVARLTPYTPFNTPFYAAARAAMGERPCLLELRAGSNIISGCLGFLRGGFLSRCLQIVTAPRPSEPEGFWNGIREFCQKQGVWELSIQSFCSDATVIPSMPGELTRRSRCEYVIDLTSADPFGRISTNHRRNINRARKADLIIKRTRETKASQVHLKLIHASIQRRKDRGEDLAIPRDTRYFEALLRCGAAELFHATNREKVFSPILIVRSSSSAYYQSAGTSPEGMSMGTSPFLISEVARILRDEGLRLFNLGGADPTDQGLRRFKAGFGAREVILEAATFSMVGPIKRKLRTGMKRIRQGLRCLLQN
ncbi:MAG: GNAT family N-acetyltransferase [Nitrospirota bacterium]